MLRIIDDYVTGIKLERILRQDILVAGHLECRLKNSFDGCDRAVAFTFPLEPYEPQLGSTLPLLSFLRVPATCYSPF